MGAAVGAAKLREEQVSSNGVGLFLLGESGLEINLAGTPQGEADGGVRSGHCQVFHLEHCEVQRLKNLFRCGDFAMKTT